MSADAAKDARLHTIAQVITEYSAIRRLPTSPGELEVATSLVSRFAALGMSSRVEPVLATGSFALPIGLLSAIGGAAGTLAGVSWWAAVTVAVLAAAAIADDVAGGRRWFRRVAVQRRLAYNVVAEAGAVRADRTVVVLAHHDAAPSGIIFGQRPLRWIVHRLPRLLEMAKTSPPVWWPVIGGPLVVAAGTVVDWTGLRLAGMALCLVNTLIMIDIGRRDSVPGANDNLSGVAALLCVAQAICDRPVSDLRLIFLSAGAEEALQEGIRGFARQHFVDFGKQTWFINLESVGSGRLVLLEGEGPVVMRDYQAGFKDLAARCAEELGIPLTRGLRSRNSTDSDVPRRYGYPVATIVSLDGDRLIPHYHQDSDVAEHVVMDSVDDSARLAESIIRKLDPGRESA